MVKVYQRMAESEYLAGRWAPAHAALDKALARIGGPGVPAAAPVFLTRADIFERQAMLEESLGAAKEGLGLGPPPRVRAALLNVAGGVLLRMGRSQEAAVNHREAWGLVEKLDGASRERLQAKIGLARVHATDGEYRQAREVLGDAVRRFRSPGDTIDAARAYHALTAIYTGLGDGRRAIDSAEIAQRLAEESGDVSLRAGSLGNLGHLYRIRGNHARARKSIAACLELTDQHGLAFRRSIANCNLAALEMEEGRLDAARKAVEAAMADLPREEAWAEAWTMRRMAELQIALGEDDEALAWLDRAEESARKHRFHPLHAAARNLRGVVFAHRGKWDEARACFAEARALHRDHPEPDELSELLWRSGEALLDHPDGAEGRRLLNEARTVAADRGALVRVHRIDTLLKRPGTGPAETRSSGNAVHRR